MSETALTAPDPADALRARLLDPAIEEAAFAGWTRQGLRRACRAAGISDGEAMIAAPRGPIDMIDALFLRADQAMARAVADAEGEKIRARATLAVRARLEALEPSKEAVRRAIVTLALPPNPPEGARMTWRAADLAWRAMKDPSSDFNWYSKRAILSAVHATTLTVWLQDDSPGHAATWAFLDRRIANVMQFEQVKRQAGKLVATLPDPVGLLTRLRYGPQPRP